MDQTADKVQLNLRLDATLAKELRVEAAQMGMRVSEYAALLLARRSQLLKGAA